jgi:hypothetical protein
MEIDMRNYRNLFSHSTGRLVGVGIPNLSIVDANEKRRIKNYQQRLKEDPEFAKECKRKSIMRVAAAKSAKKPVTLPKLKFLEKNEEN